MGLPGAPGAPWGKGLLHELATERYGRDRRYMDAPTYARWVREVARKTLSGYEASQHWTVLHGRHPATYYCDSSAKCTVEGEIFEGMAITEVRTDYLRRALGRVPRHGRRDVAMWEEIGKGHGLAPQWQLGTIPVGPMALVDISACYWQLMMKLSTEVRYFPVSGFWERRGREWPDAAELRLHKAFYASIISHGFATDEISYWNRGERRKRRAPLVFQPQYCRLVSDYLHAIAQEMAVLFGAWSWQVDGGWLPAELAEQAVLWLEERWGLEARIKERLGADQVAERLPQRRASSNLRLQDDEKRHRLAWQFTGNVAYDPEYTQLRAGDWQHWLVTPGAHAKPTLLHRQRGWDPDLPVPAMELPPLPVLTTHLGQFAGEAAEEASRQALNEPEPAALTWRQLVSHGATGWGLARRLAPLPGAEEHQDLWDAPPGGWDMAALTRAARAVQRARQRAGRAPP